MIDRIEIQIRDGEANVSVFNRQVQGDTVVVSPPVDYCRVRLLAEDSVESVLTAIVNRES